MELEAAWAWTLAGAHGTMARLRFSSLAGELGTCGDGAGASVASRGDGSAR